MNRPIDNPKRGRSYPATVIGRIGVNQEFQGMNVGSQLIQFIKDWFRHEDNKTGCRFLVVDAYNNPRTLHFYERNDLFPPLPYSAEAVGMIVFSLNCRLCLSLRSR